VVYLRQKGGVIGLVNKLKAYSLQDLGLDTVEANEKLGLRLISATMGLAPNSQRHWRRAVLFDYNNPRKIAGLKGYGLEMVDRVPLIIEATPTT
jgi:3,4-dihydroxy 2-butanone 4-phosphate synthase/GTP cyclohydrolase II